MSNVGIFIMYYCEKCGLASRSLWDVTNHLAANNLEHVNCSAENIKKSIDSIVTYLNSQIETNKQQTKPKVPSKNENKTASPTEPPDDEQRTVHSKSDATWKASLNSEPNSDTMNIFNPRTNACYNSNECNHKNMDTKINPCQSYTAVNTKMLEIPSAIIVKKTETFHEINSETDTKMHSYNSVEHNKNIVHDDDDNHNDFASIPIVDYELQNFTKSHKHFADERAGLNLVDRKITTHFGKSLACSIPTGKISNRHTGNDNIDGNITEEGVSHEHILEIEETEENIMYVFDQQNDVNAVMSQVEDSEYPVLLTAAEKELLLTSYMEFVRGCVDVVLFGNAIEGTDLYESSVMREVVKYDENRFKMDRFKKCKTVDSVFTPPVRNVSEFDLSCDRCPRWPFSSQKEFDIHVKCHSEAVEGFQFECYICKRWKILNVMRSTTREWPEMKSHLMSDHKVMFRPITCSHCTLEFQSQNELRDHRNLVHKEYCMYKTSGCKFCTFSSKEAKLHNRCHSLANRNSGDFKCPSCPFFVSTSNKCSWLTLRDHIARKHSELLDQPNMCPGCNCSFLDQDTFLNHYVTCNRMDHVCHRCIICTQSKDVILPNLESHLIDHIYSEKKSSQQRIRKIVDLLKVNTPILTIYSMYCKPQLVEDSTSLSTSAAENLNNEKTEDSFNTSETQDESTEDQSETNSVQDSAVVAYRCKLCQRQHRNFTDLLHHMERCHPEDTSYENKCSPKPQTPLSSNDLLAYESNVQVLPDGTFRCKLCYKTRKTAAKFIRHMANSHPNGTDETTCDQCGKIFRTKSLYRNHYFYKHQGKKRKSLPKSKEEKSAKTKKIYKCEKCSYTTPHTTRLRNHIMSVHMGVMPYHCDMCAYQSNELSDMKRHKNNHLGIKQHACNHCDYKAKQYWLLKSHCWKQHFIHLPSKRATLKSSAVLLGTAGSLRRSKNKTTVKQNSRYKTKVGVSGEHTDLVNTVIPDEETHTQPLGTNVQINDTHTPTMNNNFVRNYHTQNVSQPGKSNPKIYQVIAADNASQHTDSNRVVKLPSSASRTVPINSNRGIPELSQAKISNGEITAAISEGINAVNVDNDNAIIRKALAKAVSSSEKNITEVRDSDLEIQILRLDDGNMESTSVINDNTAVLQFDGTNISRATTGSVESEGSRCVYTEHSDIPVYVIPEGTVVESMTEVEYHVVIDDSTVNE